MTDQEETKMVSRRRVVSLLALAAAAGFGPLTGSDAEAQTAATPEATGTPPATGTHGMQRRHERRTGRHERRHTRRTGGTAPAAAPAGAAPAEAAPPK